MSGWRVVIVTRIVPIALAFHETLREAGHEPVALLTLRQNDADLDAGELLKALPQELDVLIPGRRSSIAPLLESVRPHLALCMGFPWKIPPAALAVPRLGWVNGHPAVLPHRRGPIPVAWAIRDGDEELGVTFHKMDAELDTGPILAQRGVPMGELCEPDVLFPRMSPIMVEVLREALANLADGVEATVQEGGDYQTFFTDDDARLDLSRPREDVHRLVYAWHYAMSSGELTGALTELDGETMRVLASSLVEVDGARRVECADGPLWLVKTEPAMPRPDAAPA